MPTYDYQCNACGHEFELFQSIRDSVKRKCPACSRMTLRRLFGTGAALLFKGSGFYTTDYRSESYRKAAEAESKSKSGGGEAQSKSKSGGGEGSKAESNGSSVKSEAAATKTG